jgi:hypothetical protein
MEYAENQSQTNGDILEVSGKIRCTSAVLNPLYLRKASPLRGERCGYQMNLAPIPQKSECTIETWPLNPWILDPTFALLATPESAAPSASGRKFIKLYPGLKPWADGYSPFGA